MDGAATPPPSVPYHRLDDDDDDAEEALLGGVLEADGDNSSSSSGDGIIYFGQQESDAPSEQGGEDDFVYQPPSRISLINCINLLAYGANLFIHYGIGVWGLNGILPTIKEVTRTHRTLITPADWTLAHIWAVIYILEGMFVIAQMTPAYRSRPVVKEGAGYFFVYACLAQISWTMFFSSCMFLVAFISMSTNLAALSFLIISQFLSRSREESRGEYFLLRFPFSLHIGWVFVETATNFSILSSHSGLSAGEQLAAAIVSLAILLMVSFLFLGARTTPGLVVPAVMIWAFVGIGWALKHPDEAIQSEFGDIIITGVRRASFSFSIIISVVFVPRVVVHLFEEYLTIHVVEH